MKEAYVIFTAPLTPPSAEKLQRVILMKNKEGVQVLHLLISSPGGSVSHGILLHNMLRGLALEVRTYNIGTVDSIGVVLFCAGKTRFCSPQARFLIHPVGLQPQGVQQVDAHQLREWGKSLAIDQQNIAKILGGVVNKPQEEVEGWMHERTTFSPEEAKALGLVSTISEAPIPATADLSVVFESEAQQAVPAMQPALQLRRVPAAP